MAASELILWPMQTPVQSVMGLARCRQKGRGVQLTIHPLLFPKFRMYVALLPLPHVPSWHANGRFILQICVA